MPQQRINKNRCTISNGRSTGEAAKHTADLPRKVPGLRQVAPIMAPSTVTQPHAKMAHLKVCLILHCAHSSADARLAEASCTVLDPWALAAARRWAGTSVTAPEEEQ